MDKLTWIASQNVGNFGDLNTPNWVANPVPTSTVPKPIVLSDAMALMTPQERFAVSETKAYERILDALNQGRLDWVADNLSVLFGGDIISLATIQALSALMQETIEVENPPLVFKTPAELAGFSPVTEAEWIEAHA